MAWHVWFKMACLVLLFGPSTCTSLVVTTKINMVLVCYKAAAPADKAAVCQLIPSQQQAAAQASLRCSGRSYAVKRLGAAQNPMSKRHTCPYTRTHPTCVYTLAMAHHVVCTPNAMTGGRRWRQAVLRHAAGSSCASASPMPRGGRLQEWFQPTCMHKELARARCEPHGAQYQHGA